MSATWPTTLPQFVESEGFDYKMGDNSIRSNMEVGLAKTRKRYTKQIDTLSLTMKIDRTQYSVLVNFYQVTLSGGNLPFTFTDPLTLVASEYRFTSPPTLRALGGNYFSATFGWEKMPI
jgi:hypothetical protein